jgi:hypothetical protein
MQKQNYIPFFISAVYGDNDNRRKRFFALMNLARALKISVPAIPLNTDESDKILTQFKEQLLIEAKKQGYEDYIKDIPD